MREPPDEWCLAYGVVLHATDDGIVVEGKTAHRVRLHDRDLERAIVDAAANEGGVLRIPLVTPETQRTAALAALSSAGAIVPCRSKLVIVDRLGVSGLVFSRAQEVVESGDEASLRGAELVVVLGERSDPGVGEVLGLSRDAGVASLLVWTSASELVAVHDDARSGPCAECALFFDARGPTLSREAPVARGRTAASDHERIERSFVSAIVMRLLADLSPLGPGRACVWDLHSLVGSTHSFPARPWCSCASSDRNGPLPPSPCWDQSARFGPVVPLADSGIARVAYRGARKPWPLAQSTFGIAIAAGAQRRERALGEAVERFCMLHAPASIVERRRRDLDAPSLSATDIAGLLFREAERDAPGFRFAPFSDDLAVDWSWAERASTSERILVPTSLVGRPRGGPRLVDATSNGYACHPSPDEARARALLELVERDALLLRWYSSREPVVVDEAAAPAGTLVLLATVDIDLPVVVGAACLEDGSLRIGSAAASSYETALQRALDELEGQLAGPPVAGIRPDLTRVDRGYGPRDHVAHYGGASGRVLLQRWAEGAERQDGAAMRSRWPRAREGADLERVVAAVAAAGLDTFFVDRTLPQLFGSEWRVVRALVPGAVEISWGMPYRRLSSPRLAEALGRGAGLCPWPHPYA